MCGAELIGLKKTSLRLTDGAVLANNKTGRV